MEFNFYSKESIFSLFKDYHINFQKRFGQNFLINEELVNRVLGFIYNPFNLKIVEIGCGIGNITKKLLEKYFVIGFEIDKKYCFILKEFFSENKNFTLIEGNFLKKFDKNYVPNEEIIIFGAIPYYITTEIIEKVLISDFNIKETYLIIQKDVLNRIIANIGTKDYGYLTILVNTFSYVDILCEIKRNSFYPVPLVDSVMIKLNIKKEINFNKILYKDKLNSLFFHRRKLLKSNLKRMGIDSIYIEEIFKNEKINDLARIEELEIEKIIKLIQKIII